VAIVLSVLDPNQVAAPSMFDVLVGEPAQRLAIFSGIAIPNFWTNHDEEKREDEIIVRLNYHVASLDRAVTHVGLASIENDETNFLFAVDMGTLEKEEGSGELLLRVRAAILGEETLIHRFGYQIVAHVRRVAARISGTIAVPDDILDLGGMSPADAAGLFQITANRIERVTPPAGFAFDKLVPVATGATGAVRNGPHDGFVDYVIDACPFSTPFRSKSGSPGGWRRWA